MDMSVPFDLLALARAWPAFSAAGELPDRCRMQSQGSAMPFQRGTVDREGHRDTALE
jgi:hypothetical protein